MAFFVQAFVFSSLAQLQQRVVWALFLPFEPLQRLCADRGPRRILLVYTLLNSVYSVDTNQTEQKMAAYSVYQISNGAHLGRCDTVQKAVIIGVTQAQLLGYKCFETQIEADGVTVSVAGLPIITSRPFEPSAPRRGVAQRDSPRPADAGWQPFGRPSGDGWYRASGELFSQLLRPAGKQAVVYLAKNDEVLGAVPLDALVKKMLSGSVNRVELREAASSGLKQARAKGCEVPEGTVCIAACMRVTDDLSRMNLLYRRLP